MDADGVHLMHVGNAHGGEGTEHRYPDSGTGIATVNADEKMKDNDDGDGGRAGGGKGVGARAEILDVGIQLGVCRG